MSLVLLKAKVNAIQLTFIEIYYILYVIVTINNLIIYKKMNSIFCIVIHTAKHFIDMCIIVSIESNLENNIALLHIIRNIF